MNKLCVREWPVIRGWMWLSALIGFVGGVGMAAVAANAYYNVSDGLARGSEGLVLIKAAGRIRARGNT